MVPSWSKSLGSTYSGCLPSLDCLRAAWVSQSWSLHESTAWAWAVKTFFSRNVVSLHSIPAEHCRWLKSWECNLIHPMTSSCPEIFAYEVLLSCWMAGAMPVCHKFLCWALSLVQDHLCVAVQTWRTSQQQSNPSVERLSLLSQKCKSQPLLLNCLFVQSLHPTDSLQHSHVSLNVVGAAVSLLLIRSVWASPPCHPILIPPISKKAWL